MNETDKPHYKIGEVCDLTGTQPYVLRFWESEFPYLAPQKNRSGQRIYHKRDIELIEKIKVLLYEKEYTIAGARKVLETEMTLDESDGASAGDGEAGLDPRRARGSRPDRHVASPTLFETPAMEGPRHNAQADSQLEAEVKNLRAKLARTEAELRHILADMDRHDES
jgi:DNA-binding transcriptional MerR regulator